MKEEKLLAILRLQKSKAIGDILAKKLIVNVGDVQQIFDEKPSNLEKINGIGTHVLKHLFDKKNIQLAEIVIEMKGSSFFNCKKRRISL